MLVDPAGAAGRAHAWLRLLRPTHWTKNVFVFAPLLFSRAFVEPDAVRAALLTFTYFSLACSAIYVFNDLLDVDNDRRHPTKRLTRPLAAGHIPLAQARVAFALLLAVAVTGWLVVPRAMPVIVFYLLLNLAYTTRLKRMPVVDLFTIAAGFVARVYAGSEAIDIRLSMWMFMTTLCLALYLAAIKRREELRSWGEAARPVLRTYTVPMLDKFALMAAISAFVFYGLFVALVRPELALSVPFVLFGFFRYWYVVESGHAGESPTDLLLTDRPLQLTLLLWLTVSAAGLLGWVKA